MIDLGLKKLKSEHLWSEKANREAEKRIQTIIESSLDAIISINENGKILEWNPQAEQMFGLSSSEVLGQSFIDVVIPERNMHDYIDEFMHFTENGYAKTINKRTQIIVKNSNGEEMAVELTVIPIRHSDSWEFTAFIRDIPRSNETNSAIIESEERYKELIELLPEAVFEADCQGVLKFVNKKALDYFGYDKEDFKNDLNIFQMIIPEQREIVQKNLQTLIIGGETNLSEFTALRKDGSTFPVVIHANSINKNGTTVGIRGVIVNNSKQKEAEASHRYRMEFEALISKISSRFINLPFKKLDQGISEALAEIGRFANVDLSYLFLISDDEASLDLKHRWLRDKAKALKEQVSFDIKDISFWMEHISCGNILTYPRIEDIPSNANGIKSFLKSRDVKSVVDVPMIYKEQVMGFLSFATVDRYHQWTDDEISLLKFVGEIFTGALQRKKAYEALKKSQEQQGLVLRSLPMVFYVAHTFGDYGGTWVSEQIDRISGFTSDEFNKDSGLWAKRLHPDDKERVFQEFDKLTDVGSIEVEYRWQNSDGNYRYFQDHAVLIRDNKNQPKEIIGTWLDVTDRKEIEKKHKGLESQLRRSQKMETIGTLAGGLAHDFNNILSPIIGYTELVLCDLDPESDASQSLKHVVSAGLRAKNLVQQVLTISRKNEQQHKPVRIQNVVNEALKLIRATIPTTIEINKKINSSCRAVMADPTQVHQVLMNLLTNSFHAMKEEGGDLLVEVDEVEVSSEEVTTHPNLKEGKYVKIVVSDSGVGMDQKTLDRIFEPFFTTKKMGEGTGLGLSVVHGIVMSHRGDISVESAPEKGTKFQILLPEYKGEVAVNIKPKNEIVGGDERILFIDDEEDIARFGERLLKKFGYMVTTETNSLEALKTFRQNPNDFDLVISDLTMPLMTGDKLAKEMLSIRKDMPIIIATGYSKDMTKKECLELGIKKYISKPFNIGDFSHTLREVLDEQKRMGLSVRKGA